MVEPAGSGPGTPESQPSESQPSGSQPGWGQVLVVAALVVVVVLGAAAVTSLLPTDAQRLIFRGPVMIGVLILGTAWLLWRISRGRPST